MALNFGKFVSKEDNGYIDGDPTVAINEAGSNEKELAGVTESIAIGEEIANIESAEAAIQDLEGEAAQAAVNVAAVEGEEKPEVVEAEGEVVSIPSDVEPTIDASGSSEETDQQIAAADMELNRSVESIAGRLSGKRWNDMRNSLECNKKEFSFESMVNNPLDSYKNSLEGVLETLKKAKDKVVEWLKELWKKVKAFLSKFLPFLKTLREKGNALKAAAEKIKRPVLKKEADEMKDHEWSERFILCRQLLPRVTSLYATIYAGHVATVVAGAVVSAKTAGTTPLVSIFKSLGQGAIQGNQLFSKGRFVSTKDSEVERDPSEIMVFSQPTYDMLVYGYLISDFSGDVFDSIKDGKKFEIGQYKYEVDGKQLKEKIGAQELKKFAIEMGEYCAKAGAKAEDASKVEKNVKKIIDSLDDVSGDNQIHKDGATISDVLSILRKVLSAVLGSVTSVVSTPKLYLSAGSEALSMIKDGSEE